MLPLSLQAHCNVEPIVIFLECYKLFFFNNVPEFIVNNFATTSKPPSRFLSRFFAVCSERMSPWEICSDDRGRGAWPLPQIQGNFSPTANPTWIRSPTENLWYELALLFQRQNIKCDQFLRWHPWPVHWPVEAVWVWRFPSRSKLPLPWWLCWSWETVPRNYLPSPSLQD